MTMSRRGMPRLSHLYSPPADGVAGEDAVTELRERLRKQKLLASSSWFLVYQFGESFTLHFFARN
jgi:hypothetical protein